MSDGNFNRALLPQTPYASGIKMGKQQMKAKATDAFKSVISERFPNLTEKEVEELLKTFISRI